jgi:hypothetical protein
MMVDKIAGDPNSFAGASEHSQQVALMAAVAHYAKYFEDRSLNEAVSEDERARSAKLTATLRWYHAIPNGGTRGGDKRSAMIAGANMKAEGAKAGVSDTCLPVARRGYHGFYIQMKAPGKLKGESAEQKDFGAWLTSEGYLYAVFDSWAKAMRAIMWYLDFEHCLAWSLPD